MMITITITLWQIVAKDGMVVKSGTGRVPPATAAAFSFQLRPQPTARWFIMTSTGTVLRAGTGTMPDAVKNLYAGYALGTCLPIN